MIMTGNFAVKVFSNLLVSLLILIGPGIESYAQGNKVSFGASGGGGYYQFNDFINEIG